MGDDGIAPARAQSYDPTVLRLLDLIAGLAALVSLAGFVWLHVGFADVVNPIRQPVSAYALDPVGEIGFAFGAIGMAVACGALALRYTHWALPRWLLVGSSVMYVLVVVFPTDSGVEVSSIAGEVHRYAAGAAFVAMTVLAAVLARGGNRRPITVLAIASAALLSVTTINTFVPGLADGGAWRGVPQRLLLAVHICFLLSLVVLSLRRTVSASARRLVGTVTNGSPMWGVANWPELVTTWASSFERDRRASSGSDS